MRNNCKSQKAQLEQMIAQNPNDAGLYLDLAKFRSISGTSIEPKDRRAAEKRG